MLWIKWSTMRFCWWWTKNMIYLLFWRKNSRRISLISLFIYCWNFHLVASPTEYLRPLSVSVTAFLNILIISCSKHRYFWILSSFDLIYVRSVWELRWKERVRPALLRTALVKHHVTNERREENWQRWPVVRASQHAPFTYSSCDNLYERALANKTEWSSQWRWLANRLILWRPLQELAETYIETCT